MARRQFSRATADARFQRVTLRSLLDDVASGDIQVPDFGRPWRWREGNVTDLLKTVLGNLPCGTVTLVETRGQTSFGFRPVTGTSTEARDNTAPTRLVVDGQQLLTALFQVFRCPRPVRTAGAAGRHRHHFHYLDMRRLLDGDVPLADGIVSLAVDPDGRELVGKAPDLRQPDAQFTRMMVPTNRMLAFSKWDDAFTEFWEAPGRDPAKAAEARRTASAFGWDLDGAVSLYPVAVLTLPRTMTADEVRATHANLNATAGPPRAADRRAA